jgi:hypothetical protein
MNINKDLKLRRVDNKNFIVAVGETSKVFHGMIKLNDTGALVFTLLRKNNTPEQIAKKLAKSYAISIEQAAADIECTIDIFKRAGLFI